MRLSSKMSKIGSLDPEILAKKWSKSGKIEVSERFLDPYEVKGSHKFSTEFVISRFRTSR